jgi:L-rhamnose mutarotase
MIVPERPRSFKMGLYSPGTTGETIKMSRRLCFALDLVNDAAKIAEYEGFHAPGGVWPQIVDDIHAQGIEGMEIWRTGDRMVMIATVADDYPRARDIPAKYDEWEGLMWTFQKALPHAAPGQKWMPMKQIFDLAQQKGTAASHPS